MPLMEKGWSQNWLDLVKRWPWEWCWRCWKWGIGKKVWIGVGWRKHKEELETAQNCSHGIFLNGRNNSIFVHGEKWSNNERKFDYGERATPSMLFVTRWELYYLGSNVKDGWAGRNIYDSFWSVVPASPVTYWKCKLSGPIADLLNWNSENLPCTYTTQKKLTRNGLKT